MARLDQVMESEPFPFDNWISSYNKETYTDSRPHKKTTYYHKNE
jgi:hypothetical protein